MKIDQDYVFEMSKDLAIEDLSERIIENQKQVDTLLNNLFEIDPNAGNELNKILIEEKYK